MTATELYGVSRPYPAECPTIRARWSAAGRMTMTIDVLSCVFCWIGVMHAIARELLVALSEGYFG